MPTFGRLIAAIMFGPLCWYVSQLALPYFPDGTVPLYWAEVNGVIGIVMGWIVAGSRTGDGFRAAIGYGLTCVGAIIFWVLFLHSFVEMISRSLNKRYDGPAEAVISIFELGIELGGRLANAEVLGALIVGGLFAAFVAETVAQKAD